jgi:glycine dehydrogenase
MSPQYTGATLEPVPSPSLSDTAPADGEFVPRHIGPTPVEQGTMLATLGYQDLDDLVDATVPREIRGRIDGLDQALGEQSMLDELRRIVSANRVTVPMIGMGYHGTITPLVIVRNILRDPSWYTAYTPYQPEISQGRLEALINFQTMIADLTGLPTANASLLDEATAVAEAVTLMHRTHRNPAGSGPAHIVLVDDDVLPQTLAVLRTRAEPVGLEVQVADLSRGLPAGEFFGVVLQYPGTSGRVRDDRDLVAQAHTRGAQVTVAADLLALTVLSAPGEWGADIVVGSSQRFGVPLGYGGPHAGYIAVRAGLERLLPGRLVGVSVDADGRPAYRLALQTREQHIRRERATSNICTAQVLLAIMAGMYAVWHGPAGLRRIATGVHGQAVQLAATLHAAGIEVVHDNFFDTVLTRCPGRADEVVAAAAEWGISLRRVDAAHVGISCSEITTDAHLDAVRAAFGSIPSAGAVGGDNHRAFSIPAALVRSTEFLTHPVFASHHSETSMLRYLRRLSDKDYALDRGMIPLGSCTMKLNASAEMEPITWPELADIHPFAPAADTAGYLEMIGQLERWLADVTGYHTVTIAPNAGSQGEFAGLLAIRGYHRSRGEQQRTVCLIPASAHGTNAASAVMAGMRVVVVRTAADGGIDLDDLRAKLATHRNELAAIMVTYPSTHGVYEDTISQVCALVHDAGGQVYLDGANLNALLGLARPGRFGGDVSHLNLHKTFCIPHGGGGPGVGPIGVGEHLAPFLPGHPLHPDPARRGGNGPVSAAPFGSAGILPITWAYIRMMGAAGLEQATKVAVLNANYIATRLAPHYPILFTGAAGRVAHECILDLRPLTKATGITVDDVAKRLVDYGFHAPTMSFPVAGTLMVEPTESEDLAEIDRFVEAMIAIRHEADQVAAGVWPADDNPLVNAPHPARSVVGDWTHPYDRTTAVYPRPGLAEDKYWPPIRRVDGAYGDRNLACSCPDPSAFES